MSFNFGFSGDDIEENGDHAAGDANAAHAVAADATEPIPARAHDLDALLESLPDKLSYSFLTVTSPKGFTARLPRRELFDVRLQIMAEDDGSSDGALAALDNSDLRTHVYEGGYKTWECSLDLLRFLLDRGPRKDLDDLVRVNHVIEMGCGTALPTLLLFQYALRNQLVGQYFTLTDYNADVLRLVTLPNLILTWAATLSAEKSKALFGEDGNPLLHHDAIDPESNTNNDTNDTNGDLYLTPTLLHSFKQTLAEHGITLTFLSGSWLPASTLLSMIPSDPTLNTFVLASETIYSPSSLAAFTEAMALLLKRVKTGKAVVAAKRVYFGVGGSMDGFRQECSRRGCVAYEVEFEGLDVGVRRALVEVQMY